MNKAVNRANKFINERCKIYYPWRQKYINRVVYKDYEGYYVRYNGEVRRLRIRLNDFGEFVAFEMLHGE